MITYPTETSFAPHDLDGGDWSAVEPLYQALLDRAIDSPETLEQLLLDRSELDASVAEAQGNSYIQMTRHTDDEAATKAYLYFVEELAPKLKDIGFKLDRRIVQCEHVDAMDQSRWGLYFKSLEADVLLFREENIALEVKEAQLALQYSECCGAMMVEFQGKERTMAQLNPFLEETDRSTREGAWRAAAQRRFQDSEKMDDIFGKLVTLRGEMAHNAACEDYRAWAFKAMHRFDYGPLECATFHDAIETVCVPLLHEMNESRRKALGVDVLRPWDLGVDVEGRDPLRPFSNPDELIEKTSSLFNAMDPQLGELFDSMQEGDSLDLGSRKGKAPGGYQYDRDRVRRPFIFMNAAGTHGDVQTMIHEAGHAFHALLSRDESLLAYRHPPIEFAEVASMGMELLAAPDLTRFYDEASAARARREHLEGIISSLCWIATIDAYQHWLYTRNCPTPEQRDVYWLELHARFGPNVSWEGLEQFRTKLWHRQLHLFEVPFYYIEYGIAQLGALQLWLASLDNSANALEAYRSALKLGGSKPLPELFETAGLSFDFGPVTVARLADALRSELASLPA
jgi:oligoendopeptidase F